MWIGTDSKILVAGILDSRSARDTRLTIQRSSPWLVVGRGSARDQGGPHPTPKRPTGGCAAKPPSIAAVTIRSSTRPRSAAVVPPSPGWDTTASSLTTV